MRQVPAETTLSRSGPVPLASDDGVVGWRRELGEPVKLKVVHTFEA